MSDINLRITAMDNATPVLRQIAAGIMNVQNVAGNVVGGNLNIFNNYGRSADRASDSTDGLAGALSGLIGFSKGLTSTLATVGLALKGFDIITDTIKDMYDFGKAGAFVTRMMDESAKVGEYYGVSMEEVIDVTKAFSLGTVSNFNLAKAAATGMMFGVKGSALQFGQLMEIAAFRGRAFGLSAERSFSDIMRGIGRLSPLILDNIGIVIDAANTYRTYAASVGKSADQLSALEKRQALFNRVIIEGTALLEASGGLAWDNAAAYEWLGARIANNIAFLQEKTGGFFAGMITDMAVTDKYRDLVEANIIKPQKEIAELYGVKISSGIFEDLQGNIYNLNEMSPDERMNTLQRVHRDYLIARLSGEQEYSIAYEDELNKRSASQLEIDRKLMASVRAYNNARYREQVSGMRVLDAEEELQEDLNAQYKIGIAEVKFLVSATDSLTESWKSFDEQMAKAKKQRGEERTNTEAEAWSDLTQNVNEFIMAVTDASGATADFSLDLAFALGEIDENVYSAYLAVQDILNNPAFTRDRKIQLLVELGGILKGGPEGIKDWIDNNIPEVAGNVTVGTTLNSSGVTTGIQNLPSPTIPIQITDNGGVGKVKSDIQGISGKTVFVDIVERKYSYQPRLRGGPVSGNTPYIVGEAGPELFVPSSSGNIIPNNHMGGLGSDAKINISVIYSPTFSSASKAEFEKNISPLIESVIKKSTRSRIV